MKKDIIKELEQDEQYKALMESVPEDQRKMVEAQVREFVQNFSEHLLNAFAQIADSPEATEEFLKELNKLQGNAT